MDNVSRHVRSRTMAAVKSTGNRSTERVLRAHLVRGGFRGWRLHAKEITGCPDFVFDEQRVAVFVDGCFWHRHAGCKFSYTPKSRVDFWLPKFERNVARDRLVTRTLRKAGWKVVRVWECQLSPKKAKRGIARIERALRVLLPKPEKRQRARR